MNKPPKDKYFMKRVKWMIEYKETTTTKTTIEEIVDKIICDNEDCKKEIPTRDKGKDLKDFMYYNATTSHRDWGRDSVDSTEHRQYCSLSCLMPNIKKILEDNKSYTFKIEIAVCINENQ